MSLKEALQEAQTTRIELAKSLAAVIKHGQAVGTFAVRRLTEPYIRYTTASLHLVSEALKVVEEALSATVSNTSTTGLPSVKECVDAVAQLYTDVEPAPQRNRRNRQRANRRIKQEAVN